MIKTLLFVAAAAMLASAADDAEDVTSAIAKLEGNGVTGNVLFTRQPDGNVRITGTLVGMPSGMYGFHIHQKGDITNGCLSTLGHFNPNGNDHGHPGDENRHVGDLGNVEFIPNKTAILDFSDHQIKLGGRHSIIGRAVVLHEKADDFGRSEHPDSKKTGNAGGRVACGVIGIFAESRAKTNSATTSKELHLLTVYIFYTLITALIY